MSPNPLETYPGHECRSIFDLVRKHKHTGTIGTVSEPKHAGSIIRQLLRRVGACREYLSPDHKLEGQSYNNSGFALRFGGHTQPKQQCDCDHNPCITLHIFSCQPLSPLTVPRSLDAVCTAQLQANQHLPSAGRTPIRNAESSANKITRTAHQNE